MLQPGQRRSRLLMPAAIGLFLSTAALQAQPLTFTPNHSNGIYQKGEKVGWKAERSGGAPAGPYAYIIKKNNFGDPIKSGTLDLSEGPVSFDVVVDEPAMVFVQVTPHASGTRSRSMALGAAVAPTKIKPSAPRPPDFDSFWQEKLKQLAQVPMNPVLTPGESGRPNVEFATFKQ